MFFKKSVNPNTPVEERKFKCQTSPPPGYENTWTKCEQLWADAKTFLIGTDFSEMLLNDQSAIRLKKKKVVGLNKELLCYNPSIVSNQGWCEIDGSTPGDSNWGFCSPSCSYVNEPVSIYSYYFVLPILVVKNLYCAWV